MSDQPIRALTVRQPWAGLILHGGKNIENRRRNIIGQHRGAIAVHAALTYDTPAFERCGQMADSPELRHVGAVVGVVDVVGIHRANDCCEPWGERFDGWHIELARPRPLTTPVPCRGFLGLWTPPVDVAEQLQAVL